MFPKTILQFLFVLFISIACCTPLIPIMMTNKKSQDLLMVIFFIWFLSVFIGIVHFINYKRKIKITYKIKPLNLPFLFYTIFIVWFAHIIIVRPIIFIFHSESIHSFPNMYYVLSSLVIAPILEEIVFRNILLNSLLNRYKRNKAIIVSSLIFGIFHGTPILIINGILLGLFLGVIYSSEKNIAHTIILHFFANFFGLLSQYYIIKFHNSSFFYVGIAINVLVSFFLLYYMHKKQGYSLLKIIKEK